MKKKSNPCNLVTCVTFEKKDLVTCVFSALLCIWPGLQGLQDLRHDLRFHDVHGKQGLGTAEGAATQGTSLIWVRKNGQKDPERL